MRYLPRLLSCAALALVAVAGLARPALAQTSAAAYATGYRWDVMRRMVGKISPSASTGAQTGPFQAERYTYDPDGTLIRIETGQLAAWQAESVRPQDWTGFTISKTVDYAYDSVGSKIRETISSGGEVFAVTQVSYDEANRPKCTAVRMNMASLPTDACALGTPGAQGRDRITRNIYDAAGQVLQVRRAVGTGALEQAYATYTYTANGKQEFVIDANGNRAKLEYDGFGRQTKWIFPAQAALAPAAIAAFHAATPTNAVGLVGAINPADYEEYAYDANSNRVDLTKRDGTRIDYQFDALNRMTAKLVPDTRHPVLNNTHTKDVFYAYDLRGLMISARFGSQVGNEAIVTGYDKLGRITDSTITMDGSVRTIRSCYDANGNRTRASYPDSSTNLGDCASAWTNFVSYDYDGVNRPTLIRESGAAQLRSYSYNNIHAYLSNEATTGGIAGNTALVYDPIGRLDSYSRDLDGLGSDISTGFLYNHASQMVQESRNNDSYAYTARAGGTLTYEANGLNQYGKVGGNDYCYDKNGNLTADGIYVYLYDVENRLVEKRVQGGGNAVCTTLSYGGALAASLRYDPMGRLYELTTPAMGVTRFVIDGDAMVAEYNSTGTLLRRYVHGASGQTDDPIVWYEGSAMAFANRKSLHANHQGSIVALSDSQGAAQRLFKYDEYGNAQVSDPVLDTPANGMRFLYTGQAWLQGLEMYYYKARIYAPRLGRFMQTDPIGYNDHMNLYGYVGNDPVNNFDYSGKDCVSSNGTTTCTTSAYVVSFPTQPGWQDFNSRHPDYHFYERRAESTLSKSETQDWVVENPTPGFPDAATRGGTRNDATPYIGGNPLYEMNPVRSFLTTNRLNGEQVVVNVTLPGHYLQYGIVVRQVNQNSDGTSTIVNWGEGNGKLQKPGSSTAGPINDAWEDESPSFPQCPKKQDCPVSP